MGGPRRTSRSRLAFVRLGWRGGIVPVVATECKLMAEPLNMGVVVVRHRLTEGSIENPLRWHRDRYNPDATSPAS